MARYSASRETTEGNRKWALALGAIGVVVAVTPFVVGTHAGWMVLALLVAAMFLVAAFSVASDGDLDGPPPRRSG